MPSATEIYEAMRTREDGQVETTPANLVANRIFIKKNMPYSFADRPFMVPIFDDPHRQILLKTGRQVSKSTTLAARILVHTEVYAPYTVLFLAPTFKQTSVFSHDRLGPTIKESPHLHVRMDADCLDNVLEKEFVDGSLIYLSYAKDNADRTRGLTTDECLYDEIQDMLLDAIEGVTSQSMFTSRHKRRCFSGTPKSLSNGVERKWRQSDQREWMVRCHHHGAKPYHQKLSLKSVGKNGQICDRCGHDVNTLDGLWVRTSTRMENGEEPFVHGYHIPQIIFPTMTTPVPGGGTGFLDWNDFLQTLAKEDDVTIANEVFGDSADSAEKPITEDQLRAMCDHKRRMAIIYPEDAIGWHTFAGVDWGEGKSSTVLAIGQFNPANPKKFRYLFLRAFRKRDANPEYCVPEILRLCDLFRVKRLHADWGGGFGQNSRVYEIKGDDFLSTNYWSSAIGGKNVNYDPNMNRFVLNKSVTLTRFFEAMKRHGIEVAMSWEDFAPYAREVLAEFKEERKNGDPFFDHNPDEPDDALHAMIYCWLIASWMRYSENFVDQARKAPQSTLHQPTISW